MTELIIGETTDAGDAFTLPLDAVTQTFGILAKRGSGKTYAASVLAEELLRAGQRICAVDPTGVWWGLRSSADGQQGGFPIVVFGGEHADVPLGEEQGRLLAQMIATEHLSCIIDLSEFTQGQKHRFVADFADTLYRANREPLHLFLDEADEFAPQVSLHEERRMLGAVDRLVRRGRVRGLGVTLITQRPAAIHKNVLTQVEVLLALRLTSAQDRKAVEAWISAQADDAQKQQVMASLPGMPIGEAWIWSPGWLGVLERVKVRQRTTFDSSATPKVGEQVATPRQLAAVDVAALIERFAATVEQQEADDPAILRRRIAELERQLRERPAPAVERVEVPVLDPQQVGQLLAASDQIYQLGQALMEQAERLADQLQQASRPAQPPVGLQPRSEKREARSEKPTTDNRQPTTDTPQLRAGERRMLETLARRHPLRLTRAQLGTLADFSPRGGTFRTYLSTLKRAGFLEESDGELWATPSGLAHLGYTEPPAPQTTAQLLAMWRGALRAGERRMLDLLVAAYPQWRTRAWLAQEAGIEQSGGTFGTYLGTLRRNGLVEVSGDSVCASQTLFLSGEEG